MRFLVDLERRAARDGSRPLLTYYDIGSGERTELSATTYANWVDKTTNLLIDLDAGSGDEIALPLVAEHPGHWVSLIWVAAAWQVGATVTLEPTSEAVVTVTGPYGVLGPQETVACSLHPLGLGFAELPAGIVDYASVLAQPDSHLAYPASPTDDAWAGATTLSFADVDGTLPSAGATLVLPGDPWPTVASALVAPVLGGGRTVIVAGGSAAGLEKIARSERLDQA